MITFPLNIKATHSSCFQNASYRISCVKSETQSQTNDQLKVNCWIKLTTLLQGGWRVSAKKGDTVVQKSSLANTAYTHRPIAILPEAICQKKHSSPVSGSSHLGQHSYLTSAVYLLPFSYASIFHSKKGLQWQTDRHDSFQAVAALRESFKNPSKAPCSAAQRDRPGSLSVSTRHFSKAMKK